MSEISIEWILIGVCLLGLLSAFSLHIHTNLITDITHRLEKLEEKDE